VRKKADRIIKTTPKANDKNPKWDEELKVAVEVCRLPLLWALHDFHLYDTLFPVASLTPHYGALVSLTSKGDALLFDLASTHGFFHSAVSILTL
jgi:hypothetical protein